MVLINLIILKHVKDYIASFEILVQCYSVNSVIDDQLKLQLYLNCEFYFNTQSFLHKTIVKPKINYINVK